MGFRGNFFIGAACLCLVGCGLGSYGRRTDLFEIQPIYHIVVAGDTLYDISHRYARPFEDIARLNGVRDPKKLSVGMRLLVGYRAIGSIASASLRLASLRDRPTQNGRSKHGSVPFRGTRIGWPINGGRLSSKFGPRKHGFHDGIDIAARSGTPVYAAHDALTVYSGSRLSGYGNLVILRDKLGLTTVYAHNRRNLVSVGDRVKRGEKIAEVGTSGRSTGAHLHFEVRAKDHLGRFVAIDPLPLLNGETAKPPRFRQNERLTPILANASKSS